MKNAFEVKYDVKCYYEKDIDLKERKDDTNERIISIC